jgi:hypothetical protein
MFLPLALMESAVAVFDQACMRWMRIESRGFPRYWLDRY